MEPTNPPTRQEAMDHIEKLLKTAKENGHRLLCGLNFPFGCPEGTAPKLTGCDSWRAIWERIADEVKDCANNKNNRYDAAAELNKCFAGEGPFWGNNLKRDIPCLPRNIPQAVWGVNLLPRFRYAECLVPRAKEVWKLVGNGQALAGIARLQRLRCRLDDVQVWPFETLGEGRSHVLAEIYPSLIEDCPNAYEHRVKDARQVSDVAVALKNSTGQAS